MKKQKFHRLLKRRIDSRLWDRRGNEVFLWDMEITKGQCLNGGNYLELLTFLPDYNVDVTVPPPQFLLGSRDPIHAVAKMLNDDAEKEVKDTNFIAFSKQITFGDIFKHTVEGQTQPEEDQHCGWISFTSDCSYSSGFQQDFSTIDDVWAKPWDIR